MLKSLDKFMAAHPWHPRVVPFVAYVAMLMGLGLLRDLDPRTYLAAYPATCLVTAWLLWRYRKLTPELNWRFHWLAIPIAALATIGWVLPGMWISDRWPWFGAEGKNFVGEMGPAAGWTATVMRAAGMSIVVPMFEELFFRSALLRSLYDRHAVWVAVVQWAEDLPVIGPRVMRSKTAAKFINVERPLATAFERTPLGRISVFSVVMSAVLSAPISHHMRDWVGTVICGVLYAVLVGVTNRPGKERGLGPVIWAHGLTNLFLCGWTVWSGDWRFM